MLESTGHRERLSDYWFAANFGDVIGSYFSDRHERTRELAVVSYEQAGTVGNRTARSGSAAYVCWVDLEAGRYVDALEWAERGLEVGVAVGNFAAVRTAAAVAILARRALGETIPPDLGELVEAKLASISDLALKSRLSVEALLAIGEEERARRIVETAERLTGGRLCEMLTALATGELAASRGAAGAREADVAYGARARARADDRVALGHRVRAPRPRRASRGARRPRQRARAILRSANDRPADRVRPPARQDRIRDPATSKAKSSRARARSQSPPHVSPLWGETAP